MVALGGLRDKLKCRSIEDGDLGRVVDCLRRGFPARPRAYWERGLARLAERAPQGPYPKYGYALESNGEIVGVLLMLFSRVGADGDALRCNLSSWCVDPDYRGYALRLAIAALRHDGVTFTNISPIEDTWSIADSLGFERYCSGQIVFLPLLSPVRRGDRVAAFAPDAPEAAALSAKERRLLAEHADMGCASLICVSGGAAFPIVLQKRRLLKGFLPVRQIIYCRSVASLANVSGVLGRYLLRQGAALCLADANGPIDGLVGRYFRDRGPKYFRGPNAPRPGDLAYSEFVVFGA